MANTNAPFGFALAERLRGAHRYVKGTATQIINGEMVMMDANGKVVVATAANTKLLGVCIGFEPAASTEIMVADDPDQQYYVQDDGVGGTLAQTNVGNNFDLVATAENGTFLAARMSLDTSDNSGTASAQLALLGFHPQDAVGKYVRCRVKIREHLNRLNTGLGV